MKNQIPLTFNKVKCPRTDKSWYEIKHYIDTPEERSKEYKLNKNRWCLQCLKYILKRK